MSFIFLIEKPLRLDVYVSQVANISRNKAQFAIEEKKVLVNGKMVSKASYEVDGTQEITFVDTNEIRYVARSALKLQGFFESVSLPLSNAVCLDIGSSTWWFSQILLENDVLHIDAVDVGTSQLHEKLRNHPKITSIENMDIRQYKTQKKYDVIVCDVSFISLHLIVESIYQLAQQNTHIVLLYKPQYEVWPQNLDKKWVPKDKNIVKQKQKEFLTFLKEKGFILKSIHDSVLTWENGNQEFFLYLKKSYAE